ncbi:hypothetical protein SAMN06295912_108110 [Sphingomonas laterariae]|uniref:Uncharacterized protein n=1 Tax=Edaphosphingomonas laterariae TaxID=861865 RepID=A0A239F7W8_9SPHN|nr:hypothetical protein [Sphingomonas laterariae]SNS53019.1 hypothetical protein SAMN06295912_108110 [Sphingomonas laterariae]
MTYALISSVTGEWLSGPHVEEPVPSAGEEIVLVAAGYPDRCYWDAAGRGFVFYEVTITPLAYQRRFSQAERIAIRASDNAAVIDWRELAALASEIDLTDADVVAGTNYLETLGLIGTGRAAEILAV